MMPWVYHCSNTKHESSAHLSYEMFWFCLIFSSTHRYRPMISPKEHQLHQVPRQVELPLNKIATLLIHRRRLIRQAMWRSFSNNFKTLCINPLVMVMGTMSIWDYSNGVRGHVVGIGEILKMVGHY